MAQPDPPNTDAYVLDRDGLIWRVVRDGAMATRADYAGITSTGIHTLAEESGPLLPFTAADVLHAQALREAGDELADHIDRSQCHCPIDDQHHNAALAVSHRERHMHERHTYSDCPAGAAVRWAAVTAPSLPEATS